MAPTLAEVKLNVAPSPEEVEVAEIAAAQVAMCIACLGRAGPCRCLAPPQAPAQASNMSYLSRLLETETLGCRFPRAWLHPLHLSMVTFAWSASQMTMDRPNARSMRCLRRLLEVATQEPRLPLIETNSAWALEILHIAIRCSAWELKIVHVGHCCLVLSFAPIAVSAESSSM